MGNRWKTGGTLPLILMPESRIYLDLTRNYVIEVASLVLGTFLCKAQSRVPSILPVSQLDDSFLTTPA